MYTFKWSSGINSQVYNDSISVRHEVFIKEQNISESTELDGVDNERVHLVCYDETSRPIGTARVYFVRPNQLKIQRVAVLKEARLKHIGLKLLNEIEAYAKKHHANKLVLSAQDSVLSFYKKAGFILDDTPGYMDAGIPHHDMYKILN